MPQLDKFTYFTQFFWSCLMIIISFYMITTFFYYLNSKSSLIGERVKKWNLKSTDFFFSLFEKIFGLFEKREDNLFFILLIVLFLLVMLLFLNLTLLTKASRLTFEPSLGILIQFGTILGSCKWFSKKARMWGLSLTLTSFLSSVFLYFLNENKPKVCFVLLLIYILFYLFLGLSIYRWGWDRPLNLSFFLVLLGYGLHPGWVVWPNCLFFFLMVYHILSFFFKKKKVCGYNAFIFLTLNIASFQFIKYRETSFDISIALERLGGSSPGDNLFLSLFLVIVILTLGAFIVFICIEGTHWFVVGSIYVLGVIMEETTIALLKESAINLDPIPTFWEPLKEITLTFKNGQVVHIFECYGWSLCSLFLSTFFACVLIFFLFFHFSTKTKETLVALTFVSVNLVLYLYSPSYFPYLFFVKNWPNGLSSLILFISVNRMMTETIHEESSQSDHAKLRNFGILFILLAGVVGIVLLTSCLYQLTQSSY